MLPPQSPSGLSRERALAILSQLVLALGELALSPRLGELPEDTYTHERGTPIPMVRARGAGE